MSLVPRLRLGTPRIDALRVVAMNGPEYRLIIKRSDDDHNMPATTPGFGSEAPPA
jgi:hypothetical protein